MGEWVQIGPGGHRAYLATPASGSGPGVLVLHAWWGLTEVFTDACDRLAADGFVALAPGLYPGGETTDLIAEAEQLVSAHDAISDQVEAIALAGVDWLGDAAQAIGAGIGMIGFSFGAYWGLRLSQLRPEEIAAVVTVYGTSDGDFSKARAAYLGHFAESDEFEPLEAVHALEADIRAAGREVALHIYPGAGHWFVEPNRSDVYDPAATELVWERTLAFFHAQLG